MKLHTYKIIENLIINKYLQHLQFTYNEISTIKGFFINNFFNTNSLFKLKHSI